RVTAIRLETMPDPSLPQGGAGRAAENGNFALTEFRVAVAPAGKPQGQRWLEFAGALSDHRVPADEHYNQLDVDISLVIDGKPDTSWESWPRCQQPHWAVFVPRGATTMPGGTAVTAELHFGAYPRHG